MNTRKIKIMLWIAVYVIIFLVGGLPAALWAILRYPDIFGQIMETVMIYALFTVFFMLPPKKASELVDKKFGMWKGDKNNGPDTE